MYQVICSQCSCTCKIQESDIENAFDCECGQRLLPTLQQTNASTIPVLCDACGEEYEVDDADAGEEMECECGADVRVPFVVVATLAKKKLLKKKAKNNDESPSNSVPQISIQTEDKKSVKQTSVPVIDVALSDSEEQKTPNGLESRSDWVERADQLNQGQRRNKKTRRETVVPENKEKQSPETPRPKPVIEIESNGAVGDRPGKAVKKVSGRSDRASKTKKSDKRQQGSGKQISSSQKTKELQGAQSLGAITKNWQPLDPADAIKQSGIACPKCKDVFELSEEVRGATVECACGHRFRIPESKKPSEARSVNGKADKQADDSDARGSVRSRRGKKISPFEILGGVAVAIFVIVSFVLYLTRNDGSQQVAEREAEAKPTQVSTIATVDSSAADSTSPSEDSAETGGEGVAAGPVRSGLGAGVSPELIEQTEMSPVGDGVTNVGAADIGLNDEALVAFPAVDIEDIRVVRDPDLVVGWEPKKEVRKRMTIWKSENSHFNFDRAYSVAFEAYKKYQTLKKQGAKGRDFELAVGEAIAEFENCRSVADSEVAKTQLSQIGYTLASLYLDAGYVYEAGILATHTLSQVATNNPVAKPSAMLAIIAFQEAHDTQFGDKDHPGELHQLVRVADVVEKQWPNDPNLDTIRYSTAQYYEQDQCFVEAAQQFNKVGEKAKLYAKAQLSAGRLLWKEALRREKVGVDDQLVETISSAANFLESGIKNHDSAAEPTSSLLAAKFSCAQIAHRRGRAGTVIRHLDGKHGLVKLAKGDLAMSEAVMTSAYEMLFNAYSQGGNLVKTKATLAMLAKLYGPNGQKKIAALYTGVAKSYCDSLPLDSAITKNQIAQLATLMETLQARKPSPTLSTKLWIAKTWQQLAPRVADTAGKEQCIKFSNATYSEMLKDPELSDGMRLTIELGLVEAHNAAKDYGKAMEFLDRILQRKPNAIDVQFEAAYTLVRAASLKADMISYQEAIDGRGEVVWGWAKLTKNLMKLHFGSEDSTKYLDRLLEAVYQVNETRRKASVVASSEQDKNQFLAAARKQVGQALSTLSDGENAWSIELKKLQSRL